MCHLGLVLVEETYTFLGEEIILVIVITVVDWLGFMILVFPVQLGVWEMLKCQFGILTHFLQQARFISGGIMMMIGIFPAHLVVPGFRVLLLVRMKTSSLNSRGLAKGKRGLKNLALLLNSLVEFHLVPGVVKFHEILEI